MNLSALLKRTLVLGAALAVAIVVIGGIIGFTVAGAPGFVGAAIGAVVAAVFLGLTAVSIILAVRATGGDMLKPAFFGIVLGGWMVKFVAFLVLVLTLRSADWLNPVAFFFAVVAAVIGSLAIDVYVFATSRMPYVDAKLPPSSAESDLPPTA
ncbi:hypothetical protein ACFSBZ_16115 [Amnibacterium flavum]|uniref:ATP synthase protein I n=1 Tax=Amnibacterium flavum TaxID=2173173 RepID=A0A2V1HXV4_9MICO|nr:hypothetical protein [Amnibacterium flavum]PVZ96219.1 hypothetical protein DDQ50_07300 [Amnibacterium flavum]